MKNISPRKLVLCLADMFVACIGCFLTNYLLLIVTNGQRSLNNAELVVFTTLYIVLTAAGLMLSGAYNKYWRYFKLKDYLSCILGTGISSVFVLLITYLIYLPKNPAISFTIMSFIIITGGIIAFRFCFRRTFLLLTDHGQIEMKKRTMIVGAGEACRIILREIESARLDPNNPSNQYLPVGIVDDDPKKLKTEVMGVEVMGNCEDIIALCKKEDIEVVLFAIPSCTEAQRRYILDLCSETSCVVKVVPYLSELFLDEEQPKLMHQIADIKVEDLLGRDPVTFDKDDIKQIIKDKICMITGGGGSIGSELTRQIAAYCPKQIIIVDIYENNAYDIQQELMMDYGDKLDLVTLIASVRDKEKMKIIFEKYKPQLVFHAAAHKHVPLMETSPEEAVKNNVIGTYNVASLSEFYGVEKFMMISTDKAVNPTNIMGATKRCCEMIVQYMAQFSTSKTAFITTRFGNVLGSNGSVIPLFKRQIESGRPVTVTHPEVIRYFMTIPEAVSLVLQAAAMAKGGEIFVLDMGLPVKITTLAENLIRMYGKVPYKDVEIKFTGLRPGEKLFEELLMSEEGLKATENKKIFIGNQIPINSEDFIEKLEKLEECAIANEPEKTIEALHEIVPTFIHE
ncbi:MAG: polysaccharide biosynthesis protein [Acutalibacteraceae bacterium]